jgi:hypothetical protein
MENWNCRNVSFLFLFACFVYFVVYRLSPRLFGLNYFLEKNRAGWQIARVNPLLNRTIRLS